MKKFITIIVLVLALSACSSTPMDQQAKDGNYHYENYDLHFAATLPSIFEYYQTQRKAAEKWTDIEFFLPTNDENYIEAEFPSYWKPLIVRVWDEDAYAATLNPNAQPVWKSFGTKHGYTYTYLLEENIPTDWKDRWNDDVNKFIIDNLKVE